MASTTLAARAQVATSFAGLRPASRSVAVARSASLVQCRRRLSVSCAATPETVSKVITIISKQLADDKLQISADSKFQELGADSLDTVEIMMALEEAFDVSLDEEKAAKLSTVQEAADVIEELANAKANA